MPWRDVPLSELIEAIPVAMLVTRLDGRIDYANARACALLAPAGEALAGRDIGELRASARFLRGREAGGARHGWQDEAEYAGPGGAALKVIETLLPLAAAEGGVEGFLHFLQRAGSQSRGHI